MTTLKLRDSTIKIEDGELVSYIAADHEYIHQKGSPGWRSSDAEMFPIIGPTDEADFQVQTPKDMASQDQHGLLREMQYKLIEATETHAAFQKEYVAGTRLKNSKYPKKSTKEYLSWPYDFGFIKTFTLHEEALEVVFKIDAPRDTPFMLGYHPAFKLHTSSPTVVTNKSTITLDEILAVGSRAYEVPDCTDILLKDANELRIQTEGFISFMLWTEVPNMLCIEPITFYPYAIAQKDLHEGFQYTQGSPVEFKVRISVKTN